MYGSVVLISADLGFNAYLKMLLFHIICYGPNWVRFLNTAKHTLHIYIDKHLLYVIPWNSVVTSQADTNQ